MRILYVEDNPANVSLVKRVAREHELVNYVDGEEALRNFEKDSPDLVLMDIQLTGRLSGLDVVRELRQKGYTVPIIAVTAYAMIGDRERCLAAGCDDYMAKPLPIPDLLRLFEKRKQEVEASASVSVITPAPTPDAKAETPVVVTDKPATPPVVETKPEAVVTPAPDAKTETPVVVTDKPATPPVVETKTETVTIPTPASEVKLDTSVTTDKPKTDDAPKVDEANKSNETDTGDIKITS